MKNKGKSISSLKKTVCERNDLYLNQEFKDGML